jgi:hypothetical protein
MSLLVHHKKCPSAVVSRRPIAARPRISGILRAVNHFDTLQLPKPYAGLAGEPVWSVSKEQVAKSFRKLSLCCHPDKSGDPEAPTAFEQLRKAKACLLNELQHAQRAPSFGSSPTRLLCLLPVAAPGSPALVSQGERPGHWSPGHGLGCSSSPPPKPPSSPP